MHKIYSLLYWSIDGLRQHINAIILLFLNLTDLLAGAKCYIKRKECLFKYSTEEKFTGEYWIDSKKIYTKTLYAKLDDFVNGVAHGVSNIGSYRTFDISNSFWIVSSNQIYALGNYESSSAFISPKYIDNSLVKIGTGQSWISGNQYVYITIRYTKTTD